MMDLIEQATLVARTLQTFDYLRDYGLIDEDGIEGDLCKQSWCDLKRLVQHYEKQGIPLHSIDLGAFVSFAPLDGRSEASTKKVRFVLNSPSIVCLCGSTRFWRTFQEASLQETLAGKIVLSIGAASGTDDEHFGGLPQEEYSRVKEALDQLHMRKIDLCDQVLILNVPQPWCPNCQAHCLETDGRSRCCDAPIEQRPYIGPSTSRELAYARSLGKVVRFWEET